jgi:MSHA biogenesis protein MshQ
VGPFRPHHFEVTVTPACGGSAGFTYAGQPFGVTVTAFNGLAPAGVTLNYDGTGNTSPNFAKNVTLSEATALGVGSLTGTAVASTQFTSGVANASPTYGFTSKQTAPQSLVVRAADTDAVSSSGYAEGSTALRSGRLRLFNAFGSEKSALQMQLQAEHWSGSVWALNSLDSCTTVAPGAVALSNYRNGQGGTGSWTTTASTSGALSGGRGTLTLAAPSGGSIGSVDVALNLGSGAGADQSCLSAHPSTTGAAVPWLRSQNGSCAATWDRDPSARASFGLYSPETRKTVHVREIF